MFLWRWIKRLLLALVVLVLILLAPVAYNEVACRPIGDAEPYAPILTGDGTRAESRTLMTYPEWHIVHAYDDYARVIADGDPHDYGFLRGIFGFWTSLCALSKESGRMGGFDGETKATIYTIGVSFTAEFLAKAAYEETLGRLATLQRGDTRAVLDDLSAEQAADYARFLQQVAWYNWDFARDAADLKAAKGDTFRDRERAMALGLEFGAKAAYAKAIEAAVAGVGGDELTLRLAVTEGSADLITGKGVVRQDGAGGTAVFETPRYRVLTELLQNWAKAGAEFREIAGNDDIMFTVLTDGPDGPDALMTLPRQGYGDYRHLVVVKVTELAEVLRQAETQGWRVEHIHDY